jgi:hypothetical protein
MEIHVRNGGKNRRERAVIAGTLEDFCTPEEHPLLLVFADELHRLAHRSRLAAAGAAIHPSNV